MADDFAPVPAGWNVWAVWQRRDLSDINPQWWGVPRDRRLRAWVEDRLRYRGIDVSDPWALAGSQVEILLGVPNDLEVLKSKEQLEHSAPLLNGEAELRAVRFFNRGAASSLPWPYADDYLLDRVYKPDEKNASTSGPPPGKTIDGSPAAVVSDTVRAATWVAIGVGALWLWSTLRR